MCHTSRMRWYDIPALCDGMAYQLYAMVWHTRSMWWCDMPAVCNGMAYHFYAMCHSSCMRWYGILAVCDAMSYQLIFIRRIFCCKWGNSRRWNKNNIYGITAVSFTCIFKNELKEYSLLCHVWVWSQGNLWVQWLGYRLDGWGAMINLLAGPRDSVLLHSVQTSSGAHQALY
jgi:hypothetical protein